MKRLLVILSSLLLVLFAACSDDEYSDSYSLPDDLTTEDSIEADAYIRKTLDKCARMAVLMAYSSSSSSSSYDTSDCTNDLRVAAVLGSSIRWPDGTVGYNNARWVDYLKHLGVSSVNNVGSVVTDNTVRTALATTWIGKINTAVLPSVKSTISTLLNLIPNGSSFTFK